MLLFDGMHTIKSELRFKSKDLHPRNNIKSLPMRRPPPAGISIMSHASVNYPSETPLKLILSDTLLSDAETQTKVINPSKKMDELLFLQVFLENLSTLSGTVVRHVN